MAQLRRSALAWLVLPVFFTAMLLCARDAARRRTPQHILSFWLIPGGTIASIIARTTRVPYSVITPGSEVTAAHGRLVPFLRRTLRHAQAIFANSEYARGRVSSALAREDVQLLPVGVALGRFPYIGPRSIRAQSLYLLCVGRLVRWKGTIFAVRALALLVSRGIDAQLTIVGEGPMQPRLAKEAVQLGLSDRVAFRANLTHNDLVSLYAECDVLLQPSIPIQGQETEGLGVTLLEAQACGLSVVASDVGGIPTAVVHEVTGLLVEPGNAEAIADAVDRLLTNQALAERLRREARARIEREFDWDMLIPGLLRAINMSGGVA